MNESIRHYLSEIGRKGGKRSRRKLSPENIRDMLRVREARRAFRNFHAQCFWSYDPNYKVKKEDLGWVVQELLKHGNHSTMKYVRYLCR